MKIDSTKNNEILNVVIEGRLDTTTAPEFESFIAKNYETLGIRPDTINFPNGVNISYTQLQPLSAPITAGAAMADLQAGNPLQALDKSLNTIADLSMLQGLNTFTEDLKRHGGATATVNLAASIPSQFVPSSLNQVNAFVDPYSRETYSSNSIVFKSKPRSFKSFTTRIK